MKLSEFYDKHCPVVVRDGDWLPTPSIPATIDGRRIVNVMPTNATHFRVLFWDAQTRILSGATEVTLI